MGHTFYLQVRQDDGTWVEHVLTQRVSVLGIDNIADALGYRVRILSVAPSLHDDGTLDVYCQARTGVIA